MLDRYGRKIDYLRISVTDRCNLRCRYCMPETGVEDIGHSHVLSFEQILRVVKIASGMGIRKVRLTGGEPLVRKNIVWLIRQISRIPKIKDIGLTTNGTLFAAMAEELQAAGLTRVNFSLDTLRQETFHYITRRGQLQDVLQAINKALRMGMAPVKINVVVMRGINDREIPEFVQMAYELPLQVRFIEFMPIGNLPFFQPQRLMTVDAMKDIIDKNYDLYLDTASQSSGPAVCYRLRGGRGSIGFISPLSHQFCSGCSRLRLTADGQLRGCLFAKNEISLKMLLQNNASSEIIAALLQKTIWEKPAHHQFSTGWGEDNCRKMYQIGG